VLVMRVSIGEEGGVGWVGVVGRLKFMRRMEEFSPAFFFSLFFFSCQGKLLVVGYSTRVSYSTGKATCLGVVR